MSAMLLACTAFAAALAGFLSLSLAMDRHHEDAYGRGSSPGRRRKWLRIGGGALLLLSLAACVRLQGASVGWVLWGGALTATSLAVVAIVGYWPQRAARIGAAAAAVAMAAGVAGLGRGAF